jgi:hypothetical protein
MEENYVNRNKAIYGQSGRPKKDIQPEMVENLAIRVIHYGKNTPKTWSESLK